MDDKNNRLISENRKARFNYFLSDFTECGIVLLGTEIKAIRSKGCSIADAYVVFKDSSASIVNMHIPEYDKGNIFNHEPLRSRQLLLHKKELLWFISKIKTGGFTVVVTKIYLIKGVAKAEIALAKGKKLYDKREAIKQRDIARNIRNKNDDI